MQEYFYALYLFTVQINGGVATIPPYLSTLKIYPNSVEGLYTPRFFIKMTAKDARVVIKNHFSLKYSVLECQKKTLEGVATTHPLVRRYILPFWSTVLIMACN